MFMQNSQDFCNTRVVLIKLLKHTKFAICGSDTTSIKPPTVQVFSYFQECLFKN